MSTLYGTIDEAATQKAASSCLLNYIGGPFNPDIITHAKGVFIFTASGRQILDWTSGQMSCLIGHGHPEIARTIQEHALNLDHLYSGFVSPPVVHLAERLISLTPPGLDKAMFLSTGGESNEAAIRLAKLYTGKFEIVGLGGSWHGTTSGALGAQYKAGRKGYGPLMPGNLMLPTPDAYRSIFRHPDGTYDWETELLYGWSLIDSASCGSLAAVILEPILSSAGILPLPSGYLSAMKRHCEARGMLLIVDEAQTAIGRAGDMFAFTHGNEGIVPDILTLSKTLGNGLPLSAVVVSNRVAEVCEERGFMFYTTHANDPLPAAVGLKVLDIVQREHLVEQSRIRGLRLQAGLKDIMARYACIGDVRGRGLMMGVEIVRDRRESKEPALELAQRLTAKFMQLGLSANLSSSAYFSGQFRICPPITITADELEMGLAIIEEGLRTTEGTQPLYGSVEDAPQPEQVEIRERL